MKGLKSSISRGLQVGSYVVPCDNSGANLVKIIAVKHYKGSKGRRQSAGIGDLVLVSVRKGKQNMRKKIFPAVVVRQRKEFRRSNGMRVKFEDNAVVLIKDNFGNPMGTVLKGPIPKEVVEVWPNIGKIASMVI